MDAARALRRRSCSSRDYACRGSWCSPSSATRARSTASPRVRRARHRAARARSRRCGRVSGARRLSRLVSARELADAAREFGERPNSTLPDKDGRGVTIALLDTGVDRAQPFLRGRVTGGIDIVGGDAGALARRNPTSRLQLERHGTELAGLLVGSGGPGALAGVAPGATRAADPRRGLAARCNRGLGRLRPHRPGARRARARSGPERRRRRARRRTCCARRRRGAVRGLRRQSRWHAQPRARLGSTRSSSRPPATTARPARATAASPGPGALPAALTVGAVDLRSRYGQVRVVLRAGLRVDFDGMRPLAGSVTPLGAARRRHRRRRAETTQPVGEHGAVPLLDFFDRRGASLVAGRAALLPAGEDPNGSVANAAEAGAVAVLFYGADLPAGGIGLDESAPIPAVSVPRTSRARCSETSATAFRRPCRSAPCARRRTATRVASRVSRRRASPSTAA